MLSGKEIQPVHSKGDQSWVFIGRTDAEAETPVLWPPHANSWLTGKDSDAGRDWGQEKGMIEDEMALPTWWTWVWVNSGSWWWTGRPGVLQFTGLQRVGHDWATEVKGIYLVPCRLEENFHTFKFFKPNSHLGIKPYPQQRNFWNLSGRENARARAPQKVVYCFPNKEALKIFLSQENAFRTLKLFQTFSKKNIFCQWLK